MENKQIKPVRAAIYARTSGDDNDLGSIKAKMENGASNRDAHSQSIEEQIRQGEELCKQQGYTVAGDFQDPNFSGRTYPKGHEIPDPAFDNYFTSHIKKLNKRTRPGLGALLDTKGIDVIIVRDIYRVFRPAFQSHLGNHIWQFLTKHNIKVHSCTDGVIDSNKFEDLMLTNLKLQIADQAKREEVAASTRSLHAKKNDGKLACGVNCLGYRSRKGEPQKVDAVPKELKTVRLIFNEYLADRNLHEIARTLNDTKHIPSFKGNKWSALTVRKVLLRPWYAGLMHNTLKELIPSLVFTGDLAIIKPDEYYQVLAKFRQRERHEERTERDILRENRQILDQKPRRGGSRLGTVHKQGRIHPFSGILKCPYCERHLYVMSVVNPSLKSTVPIKYHHYGCKTPFYTNDPAFDRCRRIRIKEYNPKEFHDNGIIPNGNGLLECLFPINFHGYIKHFIQNTVNQPEIVAIKSQLEHDLERITDYEKNLFDQQLDGTIDKDQFALGMRQTRERTATYRQRLVEVEQRLASMISDSSFVPRKFFDDPNAITLEEMQNLAHATFKVI